MPDVTYEIVQHDGGWAYKVDGVFSEPFPTHAEALAAAQAAAEEQEVPGHTETIEYEDDKGKWHSETVSGRDRPHTAVKDIDENRERLHEEEALDEALKNTFPASDPVSAEQP